MELVLAAQAADVLAELPIEDLIIGGLVTPPIAALVNQSTWPKPVRGLVAFGTCLLVALLAALWRGPVSLDQWRSTAFAVTGSALLAYTIFWGPSNLAPWLERITTLAGRRQRPGRQRTAE